MFQWISLTLVASKVICIPYSIIRSLGRCAKTNMLFLNSLLFTGMASYFISSTSQCRCVPLFSVRVVTVLLLSHLRQIFFYHGACQRKKTHWIFHYLNFDWKEMRFRFICVLFFHERINYFCIYFSNSYFLLFLYKILRS